MLNASHPDVAYPTPAGQVISSVDAALATGDRGTMEAVKNTLDADNNLGVRSTPTTLGVGTPIAVADATNRRATSR